MFKLKQTTVPEDRWVFDYLIFSPKTFWVIRDFCWSSGLELPDHEADIDIYAGDCLLRVCYAELFHELGNDGKTRLKVKRYMSRADAIELNPSLTRVAVPSNAPPPKRLQKTEIAAVKSDASPNSSLAPTRISHDTEVERDDIPF
jgi:hypothetical protein